MNTEQMCSRCKVLLPLDKFSPSYRGKRGTWCRACFSAYNRGERGPSKPHEVRTCEQCNQEYVPAAGKMNAVGFCSRKCKDDSRHARLSREREMSKPTDRECLHCCRLLPQAMRADAVFCSAECNYRAHSLQRKLRMRTGQDNKPGYLRATICKRDGWRCGICHERVNPSLDYPNPRCASLDHIIPVSRGGLSEPVNLRLVHLVCNLRRRNLGGVEQLAMFG